MFSAFYNSAYAAAVNTSPSPELISTLCEQFPAHFIRKLAEALTLAATNNFLLQPNDIISIKFRYAFIAGDYFYLTAQNVRVTNTCKDLSDIAILLLANCSCYGISGNPVPGMEYAKSKLISALNTRLANNKFLTRLSNNMKVNISDLLITDNSLNMKYLSGIDFALNYWQSIRPNDTNLVTLYNNQLPELFKNLNKKIISQLASKLSRKLAQAGISFQENDMLTGEYKIELNFLVAARNFKKSFVLFANDISIPSPFESSLEIARILLHYSKMQDKADLHNNAYLNGSHLVTYNFNELLANINQSHQNLSGLSDSFAVNLEINSFKIVSLSKLRFEFAKDEGISFPKISLKESLKLAVKQYTIKLIKLYGETPMEDSLKVALNAMQIFAESKKITIMMVSIIKHHVDFLKTYMHPIINDLTSLKKMLSEISQTIQSIQSANAIAAVTIATRDTRLISRDVPQLSDEITTNPHKRFRAF